MNGLEKSHLVNSAFVVITSFGGLKTLILYTFCQLLEILPSSTGSQFRPHHIGPSLVDVWPTSGKEMVGNGGLTCLRKIALDQKGLGSNPYYDTKRWEIGCAGRYNCS